MDRSNEAADVLDALANLLDQGANDSTRWGPHQAQTVREIAKSLRDRSGGPYPQDAAHVGEWEREIRGILFGE